jgi:hypothetical protein
MQALVDSLQALAYRMQELIEIRATPQSQVLARELLSQVRAWRVGLQDIFCNLSQHPEAADFADFRSRLDAMLERLEEQIEKAIAGGDQASMRHARPRIQFDCLAHFVACRRSWWISQSSRAGLIGLACVRPGSDGGMAMHLIPREL